MAKLVLAVGAMLLFISLVYVPWRAQLIGERYFNRGYSWIWSSPSPNATIDYGRVILQAVALIVVIAAGLFSFFKTKTLVPYLSCCCFFSRWLSNLKFNSQQFDLTMMRQ